MKPSHLITSIAIIIIAAFGGNIFAQAPAAAPAASVSVPAKGMKILHIVGTVNIMKNGVIIKTLKPGDAIPAITDDKMTFAVVNGTLEMEAAGQTITAGVGSNFTVTVGNGEAIVAVTAGAPVSVNSGFGHYVVIPSNSEIKMTIANGKVDIKVEKGSVVVSDSSGGDVQNLKTGETVSMSGTPEAPAVPDSVVIVETPVVEPPPTTVIPTQTVEESEEVSGSTP